MKNGLKILRERKGWTHDAAADHMSMSRGGFIKIERGENQLTAETIVRAARVFGATVAEVLDPEASVAIQKKYLADALADAFRLLKATDAQVEILTSLALEAALTRQAEAKRIDDPSGPRRS
jgi:transcriptional regulator with XRE-family HTH domain